MSAKGSVVESIYAAIKTEVSSGDLMPGHRVDIADLCARFRVSKSPIRNILNRLVGEALLETHAHDGFFRPWLTEQSLRDLYRWSQEILLLAIDRAGARLDAAATAAQPTDMTDATERLFEELARQGGNAEYVRAMADVNARLRPIRRRKPASLFDTQGELAAFHLAIKDDDLSALRALIAAYHQRRLDLIAQIVTAAYRPN